MVEKIKILFLAAQPAKTSDSRLGAELREIEQKLQMSKHHSDFVLLSEWAIRADDLQIALLKHRPHIVHFAGHGNRGGILLEDNFRRIKLVKKAPLARMFELLSDNLQIVVFNSCYSRFQIGAFTKTVDFTIGMNKTISNQAARDFAAAFYSRLAWGRSVENAFDLAVNHLHVKDLSHTGDPELLARKGVDPSKVFLVNGPRARRLRKQTGPSATKLSELQSNVDRFLSGHASLQDRKKMQQAVANGHVVFTNEGYAPTSKGNASGPIIRRYQNQVNVEVSQSAYARLQRELFYEPRGLPPPRPPLVFIGREGSLADIRKLFGPSKSANDARPIIIIRGWPGVGKTSLASIVGHDADALAAFPDGVLWTSLGQTPDLLSDLARWGRALGAEDLLRLPLLEDVTAHLQRWLEGKRMLLIVDDVWDAEHTIPFIQICGKTNALMMTTRETSNVANALDALRPSIYLLPELQEDDAFRLLSLLAPAVVETHSTMCRDLVRTLECLPLSIHVAGSLLKAEARLGWGVEEMIEEIKNGAAILQAKTPADRKEASVSVLLSKSTDLLSDRARECFGFLGAFAPKPTPIDLQAMRSVWQIKDPKPIVRELVGHGLLEPVGAGRFQMHSLLVAHAESLCTK
jgi:hypothetical protein